MNVPPSLDADLLSEVPEGIENAEIYRSALKVLQSTNEKKPMSSGELVRLVSASLEAPPKGYVVYQALLQTTQAHLTKIKSRKGRGGGYFLGDAEPETNSDIESRLESKAEKTLEKHLWPAVADWIRANKQGARVSSQVAILKSGGKWSNPDIVSLSITEDLGFFDVEITTVEVKPSMSNWKYFFFEAVSHKRFANRVYFLYRAPKNTTRDRDEILRYSEKFGVGLIEFDTDDEVYGDFAKWSTLSDEKKYNILDRFVEVSPAPFEAVSAREKVDFLHRLGLNSKSDLYDFDN